jgi:hypothetical protein
MPDLSAMLKRGPVVCAEGYLFECERRGYLQAGAFIPEVVLDHPEVVEELHREFVYAGPTRSRPSPTTIDTGQKASTWTARAVRSACSAATATASVPAASAGVQATAAGSRSRTASRKRRTDRSNGWPAARPATG